VEAIDGEGRVIVRTENRHLDRPVSGYDTIVPGDYVLLRVEDTGHGIAETDLRKIFEPFYTKKVMGRSGTGLGLAVVWGTVADHGGYIDVRSHEGQGSCFSLYFPATAERIESGEGDEPAERLQGGGESILVVDDVEGQRELARTMLERLGYQVSLAASGEEAVAWMQAGHHADLVVLDMIMDPGMDGLATFQRLREINPAQKAVIVSGYSETERVRTAQELGAGAYVRKPYLFNTLGAAVRAELDRA
jgi:CheY-like chemotaxis protein